jgi:ferredoxin
MTTKDVKSTKPAGIAQPDQFRSVELREAVERSPAEAEAKLDGFRDEFPRKDMDELIVEPTDRRNFMGVMSAGMALAGTATLGGCLRKPREKILPYTKRPEDLIPGKPRYFATAAQLTGSVIGVLVESQEGRPTKIEGNPRHPNSLGATDTFTQASVLELYDPTRVSAPRAEGKKLPFAHMEKKLERLVIEQQKTQGEGLAVVTRDLRSPVLMQLLGQVKTKLPKAKIYRHDPAFPANTLAGLAMVGETGKRPLYDLGRADRILTLDHDFLGLEGDMVRNARHYAWRRRISSEKDTMNRLYAVEPTFSITGSNADHRLRLAPSQIGEFLADLLGYMVSTGVNAPAGSEALLNQLKDAYLKRANGLPYRRWLKPLAKDLLAHRRRALVLVGERQAPRTHALGHLLNSLLESYTRTVSLVPSAELPADGDIADLAREITAQRVKTLFMLGVNPVYDAPADLNFGKLVGTVPSSIALSLLDNETTKVAKWVIPQSHYLETWGELVATDGTQTIQQPLIAPLYPSFSEIELLARLLDRKERDGHALVRGRWAQLYSDKDYLRITWRRSLHDGVKRMRLKPVAPAFNWSKVGVAWTTRLPAPTAQKLELVFAQDAKVYDGRLSTSPWLQELPDPITKLTWDNALLVGVATAKRLKLENQAIVEVQSTAKGGHKLQLPVWIIPGVADNTLILPLGYGRKDAGKVAENAGFNGYAVRQSKTLHYTQAIKLSAARGSYKLASTQEHGTMVEPITGKKRPIAIEASLADYKQYEAKRKQAKKPQMNFAKNAAQVLPDEKLKSIYTETVVRTGQQWGMSIDLSTCIGCNACAIACQSENNISTVGKTEVLNGRELSWIRLDRYFAAPKYEKGMPAVDDVTMVTQPLGASSARPPPARTSARSARRCTAPRAQRHGLQPLHRHAVLR